MKKLMTTPEDDDILIEQPDYEEDEEMENLYQEMHKKEQSNPPPIPIKHEKKNIIRKDPTIDNIVKKLKDLFSKSKFNKIR